MNTERREKIRNVAGNIQVMSCELEKMLHNMNDILQEWYDGDNIPEQQTGLMIIPILRAIRC